MPYAGLCEACGQVESRSHVPIQTSLRTTSDTSVGDTLLARRSHGGNVARRERGGIMDKVERSFAAATAAGFVVAVIGIVLLVLM